MLRAISSKSNAYVSVDSNKKYQIGEKKGGQLYKRGEHGIRRWVEAPLGLAEGLQVILMLPWSGAAGLLAAAAWRREIRGHHK